MNLDIRRKIGFNFFDVFIYIFCLSFAFISFYPIWYVFLGSISPYENVTATIMPLIPDFKPTFQYYKHIFARSMFQKALIMSLLKTVLASVGSITVTSMLAYAVSKKHMKGMKFINVMVIFTMFFSGGLIPYYLLMKNLKLLGSFWAMVIPYFFSTYHFIILRNYYSYSIPHALEDAAVIDGANDMILFFRISIPVSMPVIAALLLFETVGHWNDWTGYMIYVDNPRYMPFMYLVQISLKSIGNMNTGQSGIQLADELTFSPPL
ncbi:MAG TPA: carbohydrate ABC transporter permease, partial [Clostridiales bacterium]|nr:carbohydrate ABC transporter permease [Clostridiales bacterium]